MKTKLASKRKVSLAIAAGRALRRAAKQAHQTAYRYGTPIHIWRDGKIVTLKPKKIAA